MMLWFWSEYLKHMVEQDLTFTKLYHKITEGFYYLGLTINISIKINNGAPFDPWKICVFKLLQSFQCWIVPANKRKYMYSQKSILIKTIHWPQKIHISKLSTYK